ncbi:low molecular weight phosphatase family protein [Gordonia sp. CPCC 206044]|uniref:arsenate-mycothiol transferase ArsC n=1 Tax=Gordonia sp. CPCC 206044 TaxID=3140793 RepID=UPI003AF3C268
MTERPSVVFVCVSNRGKSVMAAALMRRHAGATVDVSSAGVSAKAGGSVNELSAEVLAEVDAADGLDDHEPRQLTEAIMTEADLVVIVGPAELDPPASVTIERWAVDEPSIRGIDGIERMRLIRDDIDGRVADLADRLSRRR